MSLRQLRGERRLAQARRHGHAEPEDGLDSEAPDVAAAAPVSEAAGPSSAAAAGPAESSAGPTDSATAAKPAGSSGASPAASATAATPAASVPAAEPAAAAADKPAVADADDSSDSSGSSSGSSSSGDEELVRGEFCCQHGQGMGHTDEDDVGASCYPSSKPEPYDYCDDTDICEGPCNGTWVIGFCAFNATEDTLDACATEVNTKGTGYVYTGSPARAASGYCATEDACASECDGTWCHYVKSPIY